MGAKHHVRLEVRHLAGASKYEPMWAIETT